MGIAIKRQCTCTSRSCTTFKSSSIVATPIVEEQVATIAPLGQTAVTEPLIGCQLVNNYDWDVKVALAICKAESGNNPSAYNGSNSNGSNDAGLMQVNSIHVDSGLISSEDRFNPEKNMAAAYAIYKGSGFRAWSAFNNGSYLKYL